MTEFEDFASKIDKFIKSKPVQDVDYYVENGLVIFTAEYLLKRQWCCNNGCRHCPYKTRVDAI